MMIKNRAIAKKLQGMWGSQKDVEKLQEYVFLNDVDIADKMLVIKYWIRKTDGVISKFKKGKMTIGEIESQYVKVKILLQNFGGRLINNK